MPNNPTSREKLDTQRLRERAERDRGTAHNYVTVHPDELISLLDDLDAGYQAMVQCSDALAQWNTCEIQLADAQREIDRLRFYETTSAAEAIRQLEVTRRALEEACGIAARVIANGWPTPNTDSIRIDELRSLATAKAGEGT